ncbi:MAG: hypothetical protein ACE5DM_01245 [Candidatus Nanoarchaeia archaeon]
MVTDNRAHDSAIPIELQDDLTFSDYDDRIPVDEESYRTGSDRDAASVGEALDLLGAAVVDVYFSTIDKTAIPGTQEHICTFHERDVLESLIGSYESSLDRQDAIELCEDLMILKGVPEPVRNHFLSCVLDQPKHIDVTEETSAVYSRDSLVHAVSLVSPAYSETARLKNSRH